MVGCISHLYYVVSVNKGLVVGRQYTCYRQYMAVRAGFLPEEKIFCIQSAFLFE